MRDQNHSDKNRALFKQETSGDNPRISLRDYIAQHMNGEATGQETAPRPSAAPAPPAFAAQARHPIPKPAAPDRVLFGQRLNSLDVDMGAGLEQYLPTPLFRMRVMKKRLSDEIQELRDKLNKYERLPDHSPDLKNRIHALQEHLLVLELHQAQVDSELTLALSNASAFYPFVQQTRLFQEKVSEVLEQIRHGLMGILYGNAFRTVENANTELRLLQELFAERLQDKDTPDVELGQLLNRYEHTLRQLEGKALKILNRP
jgi:hypothetical protein